MSNANCNRDFNDSSEELLEFSYNSRLDYMKSKNRDINEKVVVSLDKNTRLIVHLKRQA